MKPLASPRQRGSDGHGLATSGFAEASGLAAEARSVASDVAVGDRSSFDDPFKNVSIRVPHPLLFPSKGRTCIGDSQKHVAHRFIAGLSYEKTPRIAPTRGDLDSTNRLTTGDIYLGSGSKQRVLGLACGAPPLHKVAGFGQDEAIRKCAVPPPTHSHLRSQSWILSGPHLVCHCTPNQACHADSITNFSTRPSPRHSRVRHLPKPWTISPCCALNPKKPRVPPQTRKPLRKRQVGMERALP